MTIEVMTDNAVHADLWSHLKSMDHAVERVLAAAAKGCPLHELDKECIEALRDLLTETRTQTSEGDVISVEAILASKGKRWDYAFDFDFKKQLKELPQFRDYLQARRIGFEKKVDRLVGAINKFLQEFPTKTKTLLVRAEDIPQAALEVMDAWLKELLREVECSAME